MKALDSTLGVG